MKQTKRIIIALLCVCLVLASIFTLASCKKCKHSETEWVVVKEATATENGTKNEVCKECEEVLNTETIPAIGITPVPTGLAINGTTLTWNAVDGATGYVVKVGDATHTVTATTLDIATLGLVPGNHSISVQAVKSAIPSEYSGAIEVKYLTNDYALSYANKTITWETVSGATTYEVRVNGGEAITVTGTNSAKVTLTKSGDNVIEVRFTNGNGSDWKAYNVTAYEVTYDSRSLSGGEVVEYLANGDAMTLPTGNYTNIGYDFSGWYNAPADGAKYENGDLFNGTANTTVYGGWTPKKYTLNLVLDGLGVTNIDVPTAEVTYDANYSLPVPTLETDGADMFLGWFSQGNSLSTRYTDEFGNAVEAAKFTAATNVYPVFIQNVLSFNLKSDDTYEVTAGPNFDKVANIKIPVTYFSKAVTSIVENAFDGRKFLESIRIPNTIQLIGSGAFNGNNNLEAIEVYEVEGNHEVIYSSHDGALIRNDMGTVTLEVFPRAKTGSFTTPAGVTTIRSKVFQFANIDKVIISKDVLAIYERAFYSCQSLKTVVFEGGRDADVTIMCGSSTEPDTIFYATYNIESITLPAMTAEFNYTYVFNGLEKLTNIAVEEGGTNYSSVEGMFTNGVQDTILYAPLSIKGDYTIPDGIVAIGTSAFEGREGLTSVTIPMYVESIGNNAFRNCSKVTKVTVEGDRFVDLTIGSSAFYGCKLDEVKFLGNGSTDTLDDGAITIGASAFAPGGQVTLKTVIFGNGVNVAKIGNSAFEGQSKLDNLTFEANVSITEIGSSAFKGIAIKALNIPASVTKIGSSAFQDCASLANVTINEGSAGNITFGSNAFANCVKIESIFLPSTVQTFDGTVFNGCNALTEIKVHERNPYLEAVRGVLFNDNLSTLIYYPRGLAVDSAAFNALPWDDITEIGAAAFSGHKTLAAFEIKKGITKIGDGAFQNCTALATLTYESGAAANATLTIGNNAFASCTALTTAAVPSYTTVIGDSAFYKAKFEVFEMPSAVTTIGNNAFASSSIKKVTIPANVTTIGAGAFQSCSKLWSVTVVESETLFTFTSNSTYGAFKYCSNLYSIDLKNRATNIGPHTFYGAGLGFDVNNFTIDSKILGSNVTSIGTCAFQSLTNVKSVIVPETVTSIGNYAFAAMTQLTNITFGEGNKALTFGTKVFENCSKIESITFPARTAKLDGEIIGIHDDDRKTYENNNRPLPAGLVKVSDIPEFFAGCTNLKTISVTPGATNKYVSSEGVLYKADNGDGVPTTLLYCPPKNPGTNVSGVATLTVPKTVTLVENRSLFNLEAIKTITFEEYDSTDTEHYGKQLLTFGRGFSTEKVFNQKIAVIGGTSNSLTTLNLPSHLSVFGAYSISTTTGHLALNINPGAKDISIGSYAFAYAKIVKYIFPGVKSMGNFTFNNAFSSFTSVELTSLADEFEIVLGANSTLTMIPSQAFNGTKIKAFEIPASVTTLDGSAFYSAASLETLTVAEDSLLSTIKSSAFGMCQALTSVDFSNATSLTSFGIQPFQNCTKLASFAFPESVQSLDGTFFQGCTGLKEITLHKDFTADMLYSTSGGVKSLLGDGTGFTKALASIKVHPDNPHLKSVDGVLYSADGTIIYFYPPAKDPNGYTIPSNVTHIGHFAFAYFSGSSLTLPDGLTTIGENAFRDSKLTSVTIGSNVESIGAYAFYTTANAANATLTEVIFKDNIKMTKIGDNAFTSNRKLVKLENLPDSITTIGASAFMTCEALTEVILPAALTSISNNLFNNCSALTSVTIQQNVQSIGTNAFAKSGIVEIGIPASVNSIGNTAFQGTSKLTKVIFPDGGCQLATIGNNVFENATKLKEINLPVSLKQIGTAAFKNCSSLEAISIPSVSTIPDNIFENCSSLANAILPTSTETIGKLAFYNSAISTITIPATVTSIGTSAFENCYSLETVIFEEGSIITSLGTAIDANDNIFKNTTSLTSITLPTTIEMIGGHVFENSNINAVNLHELTNLKEIGNYSFANCDELVKAVIVANVLYLGDYAFYDCDALTTNSLTMGLEYMGALAFGCCDLVQDGYVPASVEELGGNPYAGCPAITALRVDEFNNYFYVDVDGSVYDSAEKNTLYHHASTDTTVITLPASITDVAAGAFSYSNITSIALPAAIGNIAPYTFYGCDDLATVTIAEGIKSIDEYAFFGCTSLSSVTIPASATVAASTDLKTAVTATIGNYAFANCSSLSSVTYASSTNIYVIGTHVFENCVAITQVTLPKLLQITDEQVKAVGSTFGTINATSGLVTNRKDAVRKVIPAYMFAGTGIDDAVIPANILYLETEGVFMNCALLETVTFEAPAADPAKKSNENTGKLAFTFIGNYMFYNCDSLVEIEIPNSCSSNSSATNLLENSIGYTFAECDNLEKVTLYGTSGMKGGMSIVAANLTAPTTKGVFMNCKKLESVVIYDITKPIDGEDEGTEDDGGNNGGGTGTLNPPLFGGLSVNPVASPVITSGINAPVNTGISTLGFVISPSTPSDPEPDPDPTPDEETGTATAYEQLYLDFIGDYWFAGCTSLEEITIMNDSYIGNSAFEGCIALEKVNFYDPNANGEEEEEEDNGGNTGGGGTGTLNPPLFGGLSVNPVASPVITSGINAPVNTEISTLGLVIGPSTPVTPSTPDPEPEEETDEDTRVYLEYLGNNAFKGCTALTSIDLPALSENVGSNVFEGWTSDQVINLSNTEEELAEQIEKGLFDGCNATVNYKTA